MTRKSTHRERAEHAGGVHPQCAAFPSDGGFKESQTEWPTTKPDDWCGEFEPKAQPAAEQTNSGFKQNMP